MATDPFALAAGSMAKEAAASNVYAIGVAPDAAGRANRVGRDLGIPPELVDLDLPEMETRAQTNRTRTIMGKYPVIASWSVNPRNAAVGRDDMDGLGKVAKTLGAYLGSTALTDQRSVFGKARDLAARSLIRGGQNVVDAIANYVDFQEEYDITAGLQRKLFGGTIYDRAQKGLADYAAFQQRGIDARQEIKTGSILGDQAIQGLESVAPNIASLVMAAIIKNPTLPLALMGVQAQGAGYRKGREAGLGVTKATAYAGAQTVFELAGEALPIIKYIEDLNVGSSFFKTLGKQLVAENVGEQITGHLQDFTDWAVLNDGKTFGDFVHERPEAALGIAVATTAAAGLQTASVEGARRTVGKVASVVEGRRQAKQAETDAAFLERLAGGVTDSKVAKRDPSAFARFLEMQTDGTPAENLFIPGEKVAEYFQSADMDWHDPDHSWDFAEDFPGQVDRAIATGGDVVVKTADFAAHLAGTPAWEALKDHVRLSAGGDSLAEARERAGNEEAELEKLGETFAADMERDRAAMEPRDKLYQSIRDKLTGAAYTQDAADKQAQLLVQRAVTRAAAFGREITGDEYDDLIVNQILPPGLAPVVVADQLDIAIDVLKRSRDPKKADRGASLLDWIAKQGGIEDKGGDVASMGGGDWHKGKPGKRKLIKPTDNDPSFLPGQKSANSPDDLAMRAWEAGYFPEFQDRPDINALIEAIDAELRGTPRYAREANGADEAMREAVGDLEALLDSQGLDPGKASKADIRKAVERYQAERSGGRGYEQLGLGVGYQHVRIGDTRIEYSVQRGRITFPAAGFGTGPSVIDLFQSRDMSTFIHETGHLWLEELRADAELPEAPDALKANWQTVQDWFAANGHPIVDGVIPVDAHEMWARTWERYLMEGKSPSSALRKVFDAFRGWLLSIYKVVDNLRAPITPEIREVMDRLIATDEEIEQARETQNLKALFTDAASAAKIGVVMSEQEAAAYRALADEARDEAFDALLYRTMAAIRAQRTKAWKDEEATVRAEVTEQVNRRPEFRALAALRAREPRIKLDRAWLVETYGEDALKLLPGAVPPIYAENDTTHADVIAEMNGFRTGDEMVRTLMGVGERTRQLREGGDQRSVRKVLIDEETASVMRERHGDPLTDGSIEEEALAAIHNDKQGEIIASELRALSRMSNNRPTPYRVAREWAKRTIAESRVVDSTSGSALQRYAKAAAKAAKAAEEAMLKGDVDETFRQKQAQMLNNALIAEAQAAKEAVDIVVSRLGKLAKRATIKSIDQDYLDQVHQLLEQVEFRTVSQMALDERESYEAWATAQQAAGFDIVNPPSFAAQLGKRNWSRLSVEELLGLDETVKQIVHLGRLKQKLLDGKDEREFAAIVAEAVDAAGQLPPKPPSDLMEPSRWDAIKSRVASIDASLLKMETVFDWLDGGNPNGVFNRVVFRRIADAQDAEKAMMTDYVGRLTDLLKAIPKEHLSRWSERVTAPELLNDETGNPWVFTRDQLVSMALNMGNEGNAAKLAGGYGWNEDAIMRVLNRELSAADWAYVQGVWNTIDTLWPQIAAMEKRLNGVEPEKVEARAVDTPAGLLPGGYFPVVYDPRKSLDADAQAAKSSDSLFENIYTRATTPKGFTKARTKVQRPIHLSLGIINRHVAEVVHDVTHREAIMEADRLLGDKRVMKAVDDSLGPEVRRQFRPWLQHIANEWAVDRKGLSGWDAFAKKLRTNSTMVGMGFRVSTVIMQVAGYSNTAERIGAKWVGQGIAAALRNPAEAWRFVSDRSPEVRNRMDTLERDIRENVRASLGKSDLLSDARRFAFYGIGMMDRVVVVPTWIGAYNRAISEGLSEADAGYAADKAVRQSQGAGAAKDLAAVQRSNEFMRLVTMFYSYQSALYQRFRTLGRDVRVARTQDLPHLIARSFFLVMVPPILSELLAGRGPEDDEDEGMWAFQRMLLGLLGPIPLARDVANAVESGFGYSFTPAARAFETGINVIKDARKIVEGEETTKATRNALEVTGYAFGLPTGQFATATQFIVDVSAGEQDPESVGDWWEGLTKGKVKDD